MHQTDNINLPQFVNLGGGNLNRALIVQHQLFTTPIKNRSSLLISPKQFNYKESLKQQNLFNLPNLQAPILKEEIKKITLAIIYSRSQKLIHYPKPNFCIITANINCFFFFFLHDKKKGFSSN
jgi:hypothetical protein